MGDCTQCIHKINVTGLYDQGYKTSMIFTDDRGHTRKQGLRERPFTPNTLSFCSVRLKEILDHLGMHFKSVNELIDMKDRLPKFFDGDDLLDACLQQDAIERINSRYAKVKGGLVFFEELNVRDEGGKDHSWIPLRKLMDNAAEEYGSSCSIFTKRGWR